MHHMHHMLRFNGSSREGDAERNQLFFVHLSVLDDWVRERIEWSGSSEAIEATQAEPVDWNLDSSCDLGIFLLLTCNRDSIAMQSFLSQWIAGFGCF